MTIVVNPSSSATRVFYTKTADETVSNSTYQDDAEFISLPLVANQTYDVELQLFYDAVDTADFVSRLVVSAGTVTWRGSYWTRDAALSALNGQIYQTGATYTFPTSGAVVGNNLPLYAKFQVKSTSASTIKLQWGQATPEVSNCTVKAGSWMSFLATS